MTILELNSLLNTFTIPTNRRTLNLDNLRWLERNLRSSNSNHPQFNTAFQAIITLLKQGENQNVIQ